MVSMTMTEPDLPWVEGREDLLFRRMSIAFVILFLLLGVILNQLDLPEPEQKQLAEVAPRLAKLIMEKKKEPPPPIPVKKKIKKPDVKPKPVKKPVPVKKTDSRAAARKTAQQSGLIAMSDELADLRESFDFSDIADLPQQKSGKQAETVIETSKLLAAASKSSDGIKTDASARKVTSSKLAQKKSVAVSSTIDANNKFSSRAGQSQSRSANRSQEEIERIFQKNKGAIFSIYNRELRKDPSLQGKVIIELTIAPDGTVTNCVIVSSELGHARLEKRLVSKIRKFRFAKKDVPVITVTYPIDFLPS